MLNTNGVEVESLFSLERAVGVPPVPKKKKKATKAWHGL
jgi:hypothetical protein